MFYNALDNEYPVKTYADMIKLLESNPNSLYVVVFYKKGTHEWLKLDRNDYLTTIKNIGYPEKETFPCLVEVEPDGEIYLHTKSFAP